MKIRLNHRSFAFKLTAIMLVPTLAFMIALGLLFAHAYKSHSEIENLQVLPRFTQAASSLVHNLQIERGLSAGYLGSGGNKFSDQLQSHTANTDATLREFRSTTNDSALVELSPSVATTLNKILQGVDQLAAIRAQVRKQSISVQDAVSYYSQINGNILGLIETLATESPTPEISQQLFSAASFMQGKERSGIIRAVLANTFAADRYQTGMRDRLISLLAAQRVYFTTFSHLASNEMLTRYEAMRRLPVFVETAKMIETALSRDSGFQIDPAVWFTKQTQKINELKKFEDQLTQNTAVLMDQLSTRSAAQLWSTSLIGVLVLLATIGLGFTLVRRLNSESQALSAELQKIAEGDLTNSESGFDGPAFEALERMRRQLTEVNKSIEHTVHTVRTSAVEISGANTALAQRAEEQAKNLEKTAASMEQIAATVRLTSENLQRGNDLSNDATSIASEGQQIVGKAVEAMTEIHNDSQKIAEITNVIDEIAFQTNLLALNAAVEAARAGEQGRGFAVVATEVRNLAQRSAEAAHRIKELVENNVSKINSGSELVNASGRSLQEIVESTSKVNKIIAELSTAGKEQSVGIEHINEALIHLDEVNQQNAAMVEEVAVSSRTLEEQSGQLDELISFYRYDESMLAKVTPSRKVKNTSGDHSANSADAQEQLPGFVERRGADRPWSAARPVADASGDDDAAWEAF